FGPVLERSKEKAQLDERPDRMQSEGEGGDDSEISATAGQRPEQIGILLVRRADDPPVGRDDLDPKKVIAAEPRGLREPADAAAKGEARHTGMADDAAGGGKTMLLRCRVHVAPGRSAAARDPPRFGLYSDAVHVAEMDHHAPVAGSVAGVVVPTASDRDLEAGVAREAH